MDLNQPEDISIPLDKGEPAVTLVIPNYNSGEFLKYTLDSVMNQTMANFECIIVDDASTDRSIKFAQDAVRANPNFRLIRHQVNGGLSAARNTGLRAARGAFIAFLDSDDLIMPDSLNDRYTACLRATERSDRYAGVYGGSVQIEEDVETPPRETKHTAEEIGFVKSGPDCPFNANQPMLRSDVLRAVGGFNENLKQSEDFDCWLRILRAGYWFAPASKVTVTYRKRTGSMIRRAPLRHLGYSMRLLDSAQMDLRDDQFDWSPYRVPLRYSIYEQQSVRMKRVLQFVGMNLASDTPESVESLLDLIQKELPDLPDILPPGKTVTHFVLPGLVRQVGKKSWHLEEQAKQFEEKVLSRYEATPKRTSGANEKTLTQVFDEPEKNRVWFGNEQRRFDVVFVPHKPYHVWTVGLILTDLEKAGLSVAVVDISSHRREEGVRCKAEELGIPLIGMNEFVLGRFAPKIVMVFNDWDPTTRPILVAAKDAGIKTATIVEGIQDYNDDDINWKYKREAYRTADAVFFPGIFDLKYFENNPFDQDLIPVGVPRIHALRKGPQVAFDETLDTGKLRVLINSNFSYNVLVEHRDDWLRAAVETVQAADMQPVISRHPGDKGELFPEFVTDEDFYTCLNGCHFTIQRFASGVLEALAVGVGVVYFNPHGEKVDKFQADPMGCYPVARDTGALRAALESWKDWTRAALDNRDAFLDLHTGPIDLDIGEKIAEEINRLSDAKPTAEKMAKFVTNLLVIDRISRSLTDGFREGFQLFSSVTESAERLATFREEETATFPLNWYTEFPTCVFDDITPPSPETEDDHAYDLGTQGAELLPYRFEKRVPDARALAFRQSMQLAEQRRLADVREQARVKLERERDDLAKHLDRLYRSKSRKLTQPLHILTSLFSK